MPTSSPGHSGGPLVDHQGRLIGISTMMAGPEVGMAVPAHVVAEFVATVRADESDAGQSMSVQRPPMGRSGYEETPNPDASEIMVGGPKRVAEQVAQMQEVGIRNLMLTNRGLMSQEKTNKSLKLLSEKVMPLFRNAP